MAKAAARLGVATIIASVTARRTDGAILASLYVSVQIAAAIAGAWVAHAMFELPVWQISTTVRSGSGQWLAEAVATVRFAPHDFWLPRPRACRRSLRRGPYITSAYWFTASTSFANPAVTIARSLSDTFAGIAPAGIAPFMSAQFAGMLCAIALARWLWETDASTRARQKSHRQ